MPEIIKTNPQDPLNFYLGDKVFKPHGLSRWVFNRQEQTQNKLGPKEFLQKMADSGINSLRMVVPGELERGVEPELGKYDADFLRPTDEVFEIAQSLGIQIIICLFDHGCFYKPWDPESLETWNYGIYSTKFPSYKDFLASQELRKYEKARLEFLVSHFNRYSNVFAWEMMNEMNYMGKHFDNTEDVTMDWFSDMAQFVRSIEPTHMITGSLWGGEIWDSLCAHPLSDFVQIHTYDEELDPDKNVEVIKKYVIQTRKYNKPIAITEFASKRGNPRRAEFVEKSLRAAQEVGSSAWLYASVWDSDADHGMGHGDMNDELFEAYRKTSPSNDHR
ncbi:MAG: cellulase family glycosylhydrolase [Patescibacteria group bacterium]